jgi:FkbH-like protein
MVSFQALKKKANAAGKDGLRVVKMAVLGNYSTQILTASLKYAGIGVGFDFHIYEAGYDQIEAEVYDEQSSLYASEPDFIFLTLSSLKLQDKFYALNPTGKASFAGDFMSHIGELVGLMSSRTNAKIILNNLETVNDQVFGNFYAKVDQSFTTKTYQINAALIDLAKDSDRLFLFDLNGLIQYFGTSHIRDWSRFTDADLPFDVDFHAPFAQRLASFIAAFQGSVKKCLILDLDDTLWGGVIGDDGLAGIRIGGLGIGMAFTRLQAWVKELKERGIILAVCSKNEDAIAREPFEKHPDMLLRPGDISLFIANWQDKVENIRTIQEILNVGFDSMVFLDDNPAEREIVRINLPQVTVPELPEDPAQYVDFLQQLQLFETASYSPGDKDRTLQYRQEDQRQRLRTTLTDMGDFLRSLEMQISIGPFSPADVSRIAQLTHRSNQYNLRTTRYGESDINAWMEDPSAYTLGVRLKDKFGDYGLISVVILKKASDKELFVDTWLMSCRVLKRGVESAVLNYCVSMARENGFSRLTGEYIPTPKNALVKDHYEKLGFASVGGLWSLDFTGFDPLLHYINQ